MAPADPPLSQFLRPSQGGLDPFTPIRPLNSPGALFFLRRYSAWVGCKDAEEGGPAADTNCVPKRMRDGRRGGAGAARSGVIASLLPSLPPVEWDCDIEPKPQGRLLFQPHNLAASPSLAVVAAFARKGLQSIGEPDPDDLFDRNEVGDEEDDEPLVHGLATTLTPASASGYGVAGGAKIASRVGGCPGGRAMPAGSGCGVQSRW
ncbi:hypothetical protein IWX91DRAFT_374308 [Phyllosticta citricarpa]